MFGSDDGARALEDAGFDLGATIEGPATWRDRAADRRTDVRKENRAAAAALDEPVAPSSHEDELVVLRVDYFENYAGRFLSVEAKTRLGGSTPTGAMYTGPSLSLSYNSGPGTPIDSDPLPMDVNIDPDTTPDTYIEHRELVRVGETGSTTPRPTRIRIGSSSGSTIEAPVEVWLGGGLPPMHGRLPERLHDALHGSDRGLRALRLARGGVLEHRRADPAAAQDERLPAPRAGPDGRRRRPALALEREPPAASSHAAARSCSTSRAWGHEGGNDIRAEFVNPNAANAPLEVSVAGSVMTVRLATNAAGEITSTAAQVVEAINANAQASNRWSRATYRGNAGGRRRPAARRGSCPTS